MSLVFISYSRQDEKEKEALLTHLGVLQHARLIDVWSDDRIAPGSDWEQEINQAMAQAKVAILLVTANFLNSEFILDKQIPSLLEQRRSKGLVVFPVIAKACAWEQVPWLVQLEVRPKNGEPIWGASGIHVDEDLTIIAREVANIIRESSEAAAENIEKAKTSMNTNDLGGQIANGNGIVFVGPELSRMAGLPSLADFINELAVELGYDTDSVANNNYRDIAEDYEDLFGRENLERKLSDWFNKPDIHLPYVHRELAKLPISAIFTTNYDNLLEKSFESVPFTTIISDIAKIEVQFTNSLQLVKLYGGLTLSEDQPNSIVITTKDYSDKFTPQLPKLV